MSTLYVTTAQTDEVVLDGNPVNDVYVAESGSLVTAAEAIAAFSDFVTATIDGTVLADGEAVNFELTQNSSVTVGQTGIVRGITAGISIGGGHNTVINAGEVSGSTIIPFYGAILVDNQDNVVLNTGLATGFNGIWATGQTGASNQNQVTNTGRIEAVHTGILLSDPTSLTSVRTAADGSGYGITNSGTIVAGVAGIDVASALGRITNTGFIQAGEIGIGVGAGNSSISNAGTIVATTAISGSLDDDRVVNSGDIQGDVRLNDGHDLYDGRAGSVTGIVDLGSGNDTAYGGSGSESLLGGDGNDFLDGGAGADTMAGGAGDDTYVVDGLDDVVSEAFGEGVDTVTTGISYLLGDEVENLVLTGTGPIDGTGNDLANTIIGNVGDNVLDGAAGADILAGGLGNDTYIVDDAGDTVTEKAGQGTDTVLVSVDFALAANVENLVLTGAALTGTGNEQANVIIGNGGSNILDGGAGADLLQGGEGDDIYIVDHEGDTVVESAGEGRDTVQASVSFVLGANVENLILTGPGDIDGTGNTLANRITGNAGDNRLDGGAGADILVGGLGNDTYVVDNVGDVVTENAGEGTDTVAASVSYALSANVENLVLTGIGDIDGTGNALANSIIGNGGDNILAGGAGNDILDGGAGTDTAIFVGSLSSYTISRNADGSLTVSDGGSGADGTDLLRNIEVLRFDDGTILLPAHAPGAPVLQGTLHPIDENAGPFTAVATFTSPGMGPGEATYALVTNPGGKFAIDAATGLVTLVGTVDYEATPAADPDLMTENGGTPLERKYYEVAVTATETVSGWTSSATTVKVYVNDVNEAPTGFSFDDGTAKATIQEDAQDGTVVGTLQALDPEGDSQLLYAFDTSGAGGTSGAGNAGGRFKIENGQLKVAALTDITKPETYTVTLKVTDRNGGSGAVSTYKDFLVTVNPVTGGGNEAPSLHVTGDPATQATDTGPAVKPFEGLTLADADGDTLTLTMAFTNADGALGNILSTDKVTVSDPDPTAATRTVTLTGKASDLQAYLDAVTFDPTDSTSNSGTVTTQFSFTVKDDSHAAAAYANAVQVVTTIADKSANAAPVITGAGSESAPVVKAVWDTETATPFDAVTVSDPDGDTVTARIALDGDGKGLFTPSSLNGFAYDAQAHAYTMTGSAAAVQAALRGLVFDPTDRPNAAVGAVETTHFTLTVADEHGAQADASFVSVNAAAANRAPSGLTSSGFTAAEYAPAGTVVGTLAATDPNAGTQLTYTLLDDAGGRFQLVGNQLLVADGFRLDYEQATAHAVTVQVSDGRGGVATQVLNVGIVDVLREVTSGSLGDDVFFASKANDRLFGGAGNDKLHGGAGNDYLKGLNGNDQLWGGLGKDVLAGGKGKDIFVFDTKPNIKTNLDKITDFNVKDDTIWLDNKVFAKLGKGSEAHPGKLNAQVFTVGDHAKDKNDYLIYDAKKGALWYDADGSGNGKAVEIATLKKGLKMTFHDFFVI